MEISDIFSWGEKLCKDAKKQPTTPKKQTNVNQNNEYAQLKKKNGNMRAHIPIKIYAFGSWSGFCFHDNGGPVQCCEKNCWGSCIFNIKKKKFISRKLQLFIKWSCFWIFRQIIQCLSKNCFFSSVEIKNITDAEHRSGMTRYLSDGSNQHSYLCHGCFLALIFHFSKKKKKSHLFKLYIKVKQGKPLVLGYHACLMHA